MSATTVTVQDELESLDPDGEWDDEAQHASDGPRAAPASPVNGMISRHRWASVGALVAVAAGLIAWGLLSHSHPRVVNDERG